MDTLLRYLASRKTMVAGVLSGLVLLFFDAQFITTLHDLGLPDAFTEKLVAGAKLVSLVMAGLGYSPIKKPQPPAVLPPAEGV